MTLIDLQPLRVQPDHMFLHYCVFIRVKMDIGIRQTIQHIQYII